MAINEYGEIIRGNESDAVHEFSAGQYPDFKQALREERVDFILNYVKGVNVDSFNNDKLELELEKGLSRPSEVKFEPTSHEIRQRCIESFLDQLNYLD